MRKPSLGGSSTSQTALLTDFPYLSEGDFRLFKMDSSGCQGSSVTIVTAMETLSVA